MKRLFAVFGVMLLFIACSSEPGKTPSPVVAEKSLMEELKERTLKIRRMPSSGSIWQTFTTVTRCTRKK